VDLLNKSNRVFGMFDRVFHPVRWALLYWGDVASTYQ